MKTKINHEIFDMELEASDWRYAAAIVGLVKYLLYHEFPHEIGAEYLRFRSADITEEAFLQFVEYNYKTELFHTRIEQILRNREFSAEHIKLVNELLKGNTIMKKIMGRVLFDGENKEEILQLLQTNRQELTRETFRNKSNLYANYANTGQLFQEGRHCCRLLGYYVDENRKGKAMAYQFNQDSFVAEDDCVFDFIPFGFNGNREAFFINDNYSIDSIISTNRTLQDKMQTAAEDEEKRPDSRRILFIAIQKASDFLDYDVEVIVKNRDHEYFETLLLRKECIQIIKKLESCDLFCFSVKIGENYYLNVFNEVMNCIVNLVRTDQLIEFFLKQNTNQYLISRLIYINNAICKGGEEMNQNMKMAYATAKETAKKIPDNKLKSYREKLTSAIIFKDYDRVCQILLNLSNYAEVPYEFTYCLYDDFEENKDVAYTFITALHKKEENHKQENQKEEA